MSILSCYQSNHSLLQHITRLNTSFFQIAFCKLWQLGQLWVLNAIDLYVFKTKSEHLFWKKDLLKQLERTNLVLMIFQQFSIYQKLFVATHIQTHTLFSKPVYSNMLRLGTMNFTVLHNRTIFYTIYVSVYILCLMCFHIICWKNFFL